MGERTASSPLSQPHGQRPMRLNADIQARLHWPNSAVSLGDWPLSQCNGDKPYESPRHERISAILLEGRCEGDMDALHWGILLQPAREGVATPTTPVPPCLQARWLMDIDRRRTLALCPIGNTI